MVTPTLTSRAAVEMSLLGLIWGASFLTIRIALDEVSVLSAVVHRTGWAALILWTVVAVRRLPVPRGARIWGALAVMGLLNNAIPFSLMAWGQLTIETGLTSILNAATAIFGVLAAALAFRDEPLTRRRAAGVALGFAGVVAVVGPEALGGLDLRSLAQLAVLAGTVSYAVAGVWARSRLSGLEPEVAAAGMLSAATAMLVPVCILWEGGIDLPQTLRATASIAYYSAVATALAYLLYYRVLRSAGAGTLLLVTLLIPPVSVALGAAVLGERLGPTAFFGFALLATGLAVLRGGRRRPGLAR